MAWGLLTFALNGLGELDPQRLMVAGEVIVSPPPLQVQFELRCELSSTPGAAHQECYPLTDGQIETLNEGGVDLATQPQCFQASGHLLPFPTQHEMLDLHQSSPSVDLLDLSV